MKSQETLADFTRFCEMHPDLRFWQALRNWAGVRFIFVAERDESIRSGGEILEIATNAGFHDTFYREGR